MFCPDCGGKIPIESAKFCPNCGFDLSKLRQSEPAKPPEVAAPQPTIQAEASTPPQQASTFLLSERSARPFNPTTLPVVLTPTIENAEATRKKFLTHEATVKSIGSLYYFWAVCYFLGGVVWLVYREESVATRIGTSILLVLFGAAFFWVGRGLRVIDPKVKTLATMLAVFPLMAIPLLGVYVLYIIHSAKGKVVFSKEYRAVIEATPALRYRTSLFTWILLGLLISVFVASILLVVFKK
jgi:hypothetical protein